MDLDGIEPPFFACKANVLPLNDKPNNSVDISLNTFKMTIIPPRLFNQMYNLVFNRDGKHAGIEYGGWIFSNEQRATLRRGNYTSLDLSSRDMSDIMWHTHPDIVYLPHKGTLEDRIWNPPSSDDIKLLVQHHLLTPLKKTYSIVFTRNEIYQLVTDDMLLRTHMDEHNFEHVVDQLWFRHFQCIGMEPNLTSNGSEDTFKRAREVCFNTFKQHGIIITYIGESDIALCRRYGYVIQ